MSCSHQGVYFTKVLDDGTHVIGSSLDVLAWLDESGSVNYTTLVDIDIGFITDPCTLTVPPEVRTMIMHDSMYNRSLGEIEDELKERKARPQHNVNKPFYRRGRW